MRVRTKQSILREGDGDKRTQPERSKEMGTVGSDKPSIEEEDNDGVKQNALYRKNFA
jgi:hypothetical protein